VAELLVTSVIMLGVLGTVTQIFIQSNRMYDTQRQFLDARGNTAATVDMLVRLIRQAQQIAPDPDGNDELDSIGVVADWNPRDGDTNDAYETITFTTNDGRLFKQEPADAAPVPFADRIASIGFTYLTPSGAVVANAATASPLQLRFVVVTVQTPPVDGRPGLTISSSASVRRRE
jgi:hypothetical protein